VFLAAAGTGKKDPVGGTTSGGPRPGTCKDKVSFRGLSGFRRSEQITSAG